MSKKIDRQALYDKFGGVCAYCGGNILSVTSMHVDHLYPKRRAHMRPDFDIDGKENLNPSCPKCNLHKGGMLIEELRSELERQVPMLMKNAQFNRALRFGQIKITSNPVVFHFEKVRQK